MTMASRFAFKLEVVADVPPRVLAQMSMSQLEVLEEIHHSLLERVAEARVRLSAIQRSAERLEAQRLAEEVHRAVSLASTGAQRSVPRPHRPQG